MLNDREDKFESPEESEYHFSDDDVSYEVEPETPKETPPSKENFLNRLSRSKRMLISLVVFLVLVFVVYKMVAPTSTQPTEINPTIQPKVITQPITTTPAQVSQPSQLTVTAPAAPSAVIPTATVVQASSPPVASAPQATQVVPLQGPPAQAMVVSAPPQVVQSSSVMPPTPPTVMSPSTQPLPNMVPMQSPPPTATPAYVLNTSTTSPISAQVPGGLDAAMAQLMAGNERLIAQLQADYGQRVNDFATQNKVLQEQVQSMSARVSAMEAEMQKLVQSMMQRNTEPKNIEPQVIISPGRVLPYSVQAIIPGRAWLRSDSGETVTVAEGDMLKNTGRVIKIDPYDGVVEINTGNKVVSLSYGNGT
ncbi:MAG: hypothetical protein H0W64_12255 [Gammaproteobacteria bacterium]|nr:hypothetical protein [Gammaproteobacteria bacterium]